MTTSWGLMTWFRIGQKEFLRVFCKLEGFLPRGEPGFMVVLGLHSSRPFPPSSLGTTCIDWLRDDSFVIILGNAG